MIREQGKSETASTLGVASHVTVSVTVSGRRGAVQDERRGGREAGGREKGGGRVLGTGRHEAHRAAGSCCCTASARRQGMLSN